MATTEETEDPPHTLNENDGKNFAIATYPAWDMIDGIFRPDPELKRRGLVVIESHKKRMNPGLVNLHRSLEDTIVLLANNEPKGKNGLRPLHLQHNPNPSRRKTLNERKLQSSRIRNGE